MPSNSSLHRDARSNNGNERARRSSAGGTDSRHRMHARAHRHHALRCAEADQEIRDVMRRF
jgi:hypothetical protein